jgi:hypothetical protein
MDTRPKTLTVAGAVIEETVVLAVEAGVDVELEVVVGELVKAELSELDSDIVTKVVTVWVSVDEPVTVILSLCPGRKAYMLVAAATTNTITIADTIGVVHLILLFILSSTHN